MGNLGKKGRGMLLRASSWIIAIIFILIPISIV